MDWFSKLQSLLSFFWLCFVFVNINVLYVHAQSLTCVQLLVNPMFCGLPGSSVHGILQASIPEWVAIPFSRGIFQT